MAETRCIICGNKKNGLAVRNDFMIDAIKWFKTNITRNVKNCRIVVCKECFLKYTKAHDSYQKKQIVYIILGVVFAILVIAISGNKLLALFSGAVIVAFMWLLAQLSYMPSVEMPRIAAKR
jgi:hypothetical protein